MSDTPPPIVRVVLPALACLAWAAALFQGTALTFQMAAYEVEGTPSVSEVVSRVGVPLLATALSVGVAVMTLRKQGCWLPLSGLAILLGAVWFMVERITGF